MESPENKTHGGVEAGATPDTIKSPYNLKRIYFRHENMPWMCKVKIQNIIKTIEKAEQRNLQWKIAIPQKVKIDNNKILSHGYIFIRVSYEPKDFETEETERVYIVGFTDVNPLISKHYAYMYITTFNDFSKIKEYIKKEIE